MSQHVFTMAFFGACLLLLERALKSIQIARADAPVRDHCPHLGRCILRREGFEQILRAPRAYRPVAAGDGVPLDGELTPPGHARVALVDPTLLIRRPGARLRKRVPVARADAPVLDDSSHLVHCILLREGFERILRASRTYRPVAAGDGVPLDGELTQPGHARVALVDPARRIARYVSSHPSDRVSIVRAHPAAAAEQVLRLAASVVPRERGEEVLCVAGTMRGEPTRSTVPENSQLPTCGRIADPVLKDPASLEAMPRTLRVTLCRPPSDEA